jgi:hypothetical protein
MPQIYVLDNASVVGARAIFIYSTALAVLVVALTYLQ